MRGGEAKDVRIEEVNQLRYPVTILPLVARFLPCFGLFSFGFAIHSKFRKTLEPRQ